MDFQIGIGKCTACGGPWLDAQYAYEVVAEIWKDGLSNRVPSLWRYFELLPIVDPNYVITMGEGTTPLIRASKMQNRLNHPVVFIKDERQSPTSSFKDRQASVGTSALMESNVRECVLASVGNAAAAYAAYCARADIKLWLFLTSMVPAAKMREAALYGAEVIKVTGTYDQTKKIAADFASRRNIYIDKGAKAIPGKSSMKTIAFEIAEELARQWGEPEKDGYWKAPDWYIQAVSGGIGPLGVHKGFEELYKMGLIDRVPKIGIIQVDGCSPMAQAFAADQPKATPMIPKTRITVLSTGEPGLSYELLYRAAKKYGGHMLSVSDDEAFAAMRLLARTEGYSVEPATAVAFAGVDKLIRQKIIKTDEIVVINCSGHTFPVEKHIMDEENVLDIRLSRPDESSPSTTPTDGLVSALEHLDEQVTTIVVIDDDPMDSRLIRRLLQARKPYRVFEANSALEGLEVIRERLPDLVVSDLNMPEMDGFTLVEELKQDPITSQIPVIVVSAKDLTPEDKERLSGQTSSIWMKGAFSTKDLVEHVVGTLSRTEEEEKELEERESARRQQPRVTKTVEPVSKMDSSKDIKKVVLIEDNPLDARLISRLLHASRSIAIKQVQFGQEAIKIIQKERPDLILLDLMIPDMNGFQILEILNADETLRKIPVIVITSKHLVQDELTWLKSNGVVSVWQKEELNRERLLADVEAQLA